MNSVKMTVLSMSSRVALWIERPPGVWEVIGSIPVGDSNLFFFLHSSYVDQFTFHNVSSVP